MPKLLVVVDGIEIGEGEEWKERQREGERELGFGARCLDRDFLWGRWWAGSVRQTRRGVAGPLHIRPIFGSDIRGAGQPERLSAV